MAATAQCPSTNPEVFIAGTEPVAFCTLHGGRGGATTVAGWETAAPAAPAVPPANLAPSFSGAAGDGRSDGDSAARRAARQAGGAAQPTAKALPVPPKQDEKKEPEKKKGILQRIFGVFK
jgi:hypothetical protein